MECKKFILILGVSSFFLILLGCNANAEFKNTERLSAHIYFTPHLLAQVIKYAHENKDGVPYGDWRAYLGNDSLLENFSVIKLNSLSLSLPISFDLISNGDKLDGYYKFAQKKRQTSIKLFIDSLDSAIHTSSELRNQIIEELGGLSSICIDNKSCDVVEHFGNLFECKDDVFFAIVSFIEDEKGVEYCRLGYLGFNEKLRLFIQYEFIVDGGRGNIELNQVLFSEIISSLKNNGNFIIPSSMKLINILPLNFEN